MASGVPTTIPGASQAIYTPAPGANGVAIIYGWSMRHTAAFHVRFRAGTTISGPIVAVAEATAAGASSQSFPNGIRCAGGIFVEVVAGTPEGAVYTN